MSRVLIANAIISPLSLRWIADQLAADERAQVITWADDLRTVELMEEALAAHAPRWAVPTGRSTCWSSSAGRGGRTGARDVAAALEVARAVAEAPHLRLAGVGGYEAALAADSDAASLAVGAGLPRRHCATCTGASPPRAGIRRALVPIVTAGGSAYFDDVAEVLGPLLADGRPGSSCGRVPTSPTTTATTGTSARWVRTRAPRAPGWSARCTAGCG